MDDHLDNLARFARRVASTQDRQLRTVTLTTRERLLAPAAAHSQRHARAPALVLAVIALAACIVWLTRPQAISFEVGSGGEAGRVGAWIAAPEGGALPLQFSDGSTLRLEAATRARVASTGPAGAHVVLERGAIDVDVRHLPDRAWTIDVGPYTVLVTGTRFHVAWSAEDETFRLQMIEGSVRVSGPRIEEGRSATAGEVLEARVREPLPSTQAPPSMASPPEPTQEAIAETSAPPGDMARPLASHPTTAATALPAPPRASAASAPTSPAWADLARAQRFDDALAAADRAGFDRTCEAAASADLLILADVARFGSRPAQAEQAYLAARRRFPGSADAARAAFLLGRLAFDQRGAFAAAAEWFGTYLHEQPSGAFAREASGRLLESLERSGDIDGATEAARRYLAAYPGGPHAERAKSLVTR